MELITKLVNMHESMKKNDSVLCPKYLAEKFFIYLKMNDQNFTFKLQDNKILFTVK